MRDIIQAKGERPRWQVIAFTLAVVLVALVIANWSGWRAQAGVGAAYGARMTCSCRYVQGRDLTSCATDTEPGMGIVQISDDPLGKTVTGSVPLMASRTARYKPGYGCLLDPLK